MIIIDMNTGPMESECSIDILLSTYNGERYLQEQINSIVNQNFDNWRLLIRDDGSEDMTCAIIHKLAENFPGRISVLTDKLGNLGPAQSYSQLARHSRADYVAFCDQDDVWLPDKLREQISIMQEQERLLGPGCPILLHSDLYIVDDKMRPLGESYWKSRGVKPEVMNDLKSLLTKNYVTGCTVLANRALLDLALPLPKSIIMHDWWFALMAAANGKIIDMNGRTVNYRQHSANVIGGSYGHIEAIFRLIKRKQLHLKKYMEITRKQAEALLATGKVYGKSKNIIDEYLKLYELGWFKRRVTAIRKRYFRYGMIRNILIMIYI